MIKNIEKVPKISVVIPAYNTRNYIDKCIESLINQELKHIEIIVIIDGATDGTEEIVRDYANKDDRIKMKIIGNSGAAIARNKGLELASGEYVIFLDSDDFLNISSLNELYKNAIDTGADVVCFGYNRVFENGTMVDETRTKKVEHNIVDISTFKGKELLGHFLSLYGQGVSNKFIKRDLLVKNNIKFELDKQTQAEDLYVSYWILSTRPLVSIVNKPFYNYVQHNNSSLHRESNGIGDRYLQLFERIYKNIKVEDKEVFEPVIAWLAFYMTTFIFNNWHWKRWKWLKTEISNYRNNLTFCYLINEILKVKRINNESVNLYITRIMFSFLFKIRLDFIAFKLLYIRISIYNIINKYIKSRR